MEMNKELNLSREEAIRYRLPLRECLIGDAQFYRRVAMVVVPMILQNTLSNVVGLLDNVMVGRVGTLPMSAVAIVNQLMFVFYLCVFGALSGAGIFSTQYFGKGDQDGVRNVMRIKLVVAMVICAGAILIFLTAGPALIGNYIAKDTDAQTRAATMQYARQYLAVMLVGLIPFGFTQVYASAFRESGNTRLPMISSMIAMSINFVFNWLLIFGMLGFPKLGVVGAAVATVISRFVEMLILVVSVHRRADRYPFIQGLYHPFTIPRELIFPVLTKTLPLFMNEFLWSLGQATLMQCYSVRGIDVIAAMNISSTISQIFNEVFISLGGAAGILIGQELGANRLVNARRTSWRIAALGTACTVLLGACLFTVAPLFPRIYNTEAEIRLLASSFIRVVALCMPIHSFANVAYFTMRSGGKTLVTFIFDSCFAWIVSIPAAFLLSRFTGLPSLSIFICVSVLDLLKCVFGFILMRRGVWVKNLVEEV